jgi:hypothetical protein
MGVVEREFRDVLTSHLRGNGGIEDTADIAASAVRASAGITTSGRGERPLAAWSS